MILHGTGSPPEIASTGTTVRLAVFTLRRSIYRQSLVVFLSLFLVSCGNDATGPDPEPVIDTRGKIIGLTKIGTFTPTDIQTLVDADDDFSLPPGVALVSPVHVFTVVYSTVVQMPGMTVPEQTVASGALFVPKNDAPKSVLTLLHGTESKRDRVASVHPANSNEGMIGICVASGGTYVVCLPDYPGYGVSDIVHPYFNIDANVPAIIDMMRATKNYCNDNETKWNGRLFLTGYSEGGFFAYHTQRVIEESSSDLFDLTAVAPMAGPYDLAGTIESVLASSEYVDLAYIGFMFTAFDNAYGWNKLEDIFNEPYAALMPSLYDGSLTWSEILAILPDTFADLVSSEFVDRYLAGDEPSIAEAFAENTILEWSAIAPIRFFHGDADRVVPVTNAYTAIERLNANGSGIVELAVIEGGTHLTAGGPALLGMLEWFNSH